MKLEGKVALVTGGSSGIGEAICELFASEGAAVAVVASSSPEKAGAVTERIGAAGGVAKPYAADVRDVAAVNGLVDAVSSDLGDIDILVNCAGIFYETPAGATAEEDYDRMADTNLKGAFFTINAVVPGMKERGSGKIVNFSSVAGFRGVPGFGVYCAVKAGIAALTRAFATELAPFNINVNAVAPGNTATPMNEALRTDKANAEYLAGMERVTPSNRTFTPPREVARIALMLASDEGLAMHGSVILIDEGISAGL